jgi:hypothetical protein
MGAWSGEPFGNDTAADWAWELDDAADWQPVRGALEEALRPDEYLDDDAASIAIAAAEVVAHGLGRATQNDSYTESVRAFVDRVETPPADLASVALAALAAATRPESGLAESWAEDPREWDAANEKVRDALG